MSLPERLYRVVLGFYPAEHRRAYARPMQQHARDLYRDARRQGRGPVLRLCFRLLKDGLANAVIEHLEVIKMAERRFKPVPWWSVLLAAFPGLLVALSRRTIEPLGPVLAVLAYLYLGLLLLGIPLIWWRKRRFPVWALLPLGAVLWLLTYLAGSALASGVNALFSPGSRGIGMEVGIAILDLLAALVLFVALLRGRRLSLSFWLVAGLILAGNLLAAIPYSLDLFGSSRLLPGILTYFTSSGIGPVDGLFLVAAGLLAVRQHGILSILVVVGGYSYMSGDSDYMWGSPDRTWPYITLFLVAITFIYWVVTPVALLRARTRLGRLAAVFLPMLAFHLARLVVPSLVLTGTFRLPWGDTVLSANVLLVLVLAWVLYSQLDSPSHQPVNEPEVEQIEGVGPLTNRAV